MARGLSLEDARDYCIIGCVEPQKGAKTDGWHDAAFFNMCRPLELVFSRGKDAGEQIGPDTGEFKNMKTFDLNIKDGIFIDVYVVADTIA